MLATAPAAGAAAHGTGPAGPARPAGAPVRLTSQDIFGDVLAEVEGQLGGRTNFPPTPPGLAPQGAGRAGGPRAVPPPGDAARQTLRADGDVQRKLEKTLSGLLGPDPRVTRGTAPAAGAGSTPAIPSNIATPRAPSGPAAPRRADAGTQDIDALLSRTLSELGARPMRSGTLGGAPVPGSAVPGPAAPSRAAAPGSPAGTAAPPAAAPGTAGAPAAGPGAPAVGAAAGPSITPAAPPASASVGEGTGVRRRLTGELDLSELEELARTRRRTEPAPPASPVSPPAPASRPGQPSPSSVPPPAAAPPPAPWPATPGAAPGPSAPPPSAAAASAATSRLRAPQFAPPASPAAAPSSGLPPPAAAPPPPAAAPSAGLPLPAAAWAAASSAATQRIQMPPREPAREGDTGTQFGQYSLLDRIAVGGMAEVWKARMRGVEGFQKTVAIKRILPYMTDNSEFVGMFIDEAKLAAQLSHPNIIHIYDLGKIGPDYYIAMEYVEGKDLRSLLNAGRNRGLPLPPGLALLIAARLASALDYAHRKRDFEGRQMGLVHRDVSPQNVLISFDGDVKLCDFGIAKAVSKAGQTQMGALKGKLQYMSPEQARGSAVDARSDIFSLGTVLFEMLTGERLFDGDSEMSVLEAVRQVRVRSPRQVNPAIPREVEDIVMRALAGRPEDRFQTSGEVEQRLESLLYALKPSPSSSDLAAYVLRVADKVPAAARGERPAATPRAPEAVAPAPMAAAPPPVRPSPPTLPAVPAVPAPPATAALAPPAAVPSPPFAAAPAAAALPMVSPLAAAAGAAAVAPATAAAVAPALEPLAADAIVPHEESGSRRGRLLLLAVIVLLALIGLVLVVVRGRHPAANPATPQPPGAQGPGAAPGAGGAAGAAAGGAPAGPAAAGAGRTQAAAAGGKVDVEGIVGQELARREQEIKQKLEDQKKQLQKELEQEKSAKSGTPPAAAPGAAPAGGPAAGLPSAPPSRATPPVAEPQRAAAEPAAAGAVVPPPPAAAPPEPARTRNVEPPSSRPAPAATPPSAGGAAAAASGGEAAVTGAVVPPKLVSSIKPEYPPLARKLRVEGIVVLSVLVDEQGRVQDVQLLERSENEGLNEAARQVAQTAQFRPATRNGVPVKMWARLRIPFKLTQ
jgi:TonB family protein